MDELIEPGTKVAPEKFKIVISLNGPYLVYGRPPLRQEFIMNDRDGASWVYKAGKEYATGTEPTALCRCGESRNAPYCDGSHERAGWDPRLTASRKPLLEGAEEINGPTVTLTDNSEYCAFARFCDAQGRVWNLASMEGEKAAELTIREANHCPAGRLKAWDNETEKPHEPEFEPSLALIEDPTIQSSGPIWVKGGIGFAAQDGGKYETRNRVTLCRCGQSSNKPFCNGTHASMHFNDGLPKKPVPDGEEW